MLDLSMHGILKILANPQNIYDGVILGLNYLPTKPVAVATAAIASGVAIYVLQPETLLNQVSVVCISSGLGWAATKTTQYVANILWKKRLAKIDADLKEYEKTPEAIEQKRQLDESINQLLDNLKILNCVPPASVRENVP
jgi:hypothetical protein